MTTSQTWLGYARGGAARSRCSEEQFMFFNVPFMFRRRLKVKELLIQTFESEYSRLKKPHIVANEINLIIIIFMIIIIYLLVIDLFSY